MVLVTFMRSFAGRFTLCHWREGGQIHLHLFCFICLCLGFFRGFRKDYCFPESAGLMLSTKM